MDSSKSQMKSRGKNIMETVSGRISADSITPGDSFKTKSPRTESGRHRDNNTLTNHIEGLSSEELVRTCANMESGENNDHVDGDLHRYGSNVFAKDESKIPNKRKKCRFIKKSGHCNVSHSHLQDKPQRFLADIFTTCVDLKWRWNLFLFSAAFVLSWFIFGVVYWITAFAHGDFAELPENRPEKVCINNLDPETSFISAFLFSLETQTTIGYGYRVVNEVCPMAIFTVVVQSVFGCFIDAFMIGLIMAKISRPKKRAETLLFSKKAVVNVRDGQLCLMVRVGNLRKSHLVEATIRMQFLHSRTTAEGEFIPLEQIDLKLDLKNDSDRLFLVTPQTISHPIDEDSPLYNLSKESLAASDFEIIVILEGMVEATGMTTQARASYIPEEVMWGHRFENVITFSQTDGYHVNFKKFDTTHPSPNSPLCSAKDLANGSPMITNGRADAVTRRISSRGSRKINREDSNASEGRDSGYTLEEEDPSTNGKRTVERSSISSKGFRSTPSGSSTNVSRKSWLKDDRVSGDGEKSQSSSESVILSIEDERSLGKKRHSVEIAAERTKEKNSKNSAMTEAVNINGSPRSNTLPSKSSRQFDEPPFQSKPEEATMLLVDQSEKVPMIDMAISPANSVPQADSPV